MVVFSAGRNFLFRIPEGEELLGFINKFAEMDEISVGSISGIGSLRNPKTGYFDKEAGEYRVTELTGLYELVSMMGNISLKDGKPFAHIHVSLGGPDGRLHGGHLVREKSSWLKFSFRSSLESLWKENRREKDWCSGTPHKIAITRRSAQNTEFNLPPSTGIIAPFM